MAIPAACLQQLDESSHRKSANAVTVDVYGCYSGMRKRADLVIAEPGDLVLLPWLALSGEFKSCYDPITLPVNSSLLCRKPRRGTRSASYSTLSLHHRWCTEGLMRDSIP